MKCCDNIQTTPVKRDPVKTRESLLEAAYEAIHEGGFQSVSIDAILKQTGVTKGAMYHHFPNKHSLGYAIIDEIIVPQLHKEWIEPIIGQDDPVQALEAALQHTAETMTLDEIRVGCPLNNLTQEMSTIDEGFRTRLQHACDEWHIALTTAIEHGKKCETVKSDIDSEATARFIIASMEGCIGLAKNAQSMDVLLQCGQGILSYLQTLKL